jgi:hypothetical protein
MKGRIPGVAAIVFAVLWITSLLMIPILPGIDKSGADVVSYLTAHSHQMRAQALMFTVGSLALVVVLGYARATLNGPSAYVFTIGSAVMLVEVSIEMWFIGGLALHAQSLDPGTARALLDVPSMFGPILTAADVMVAVPIVLAAKAGRFPRWLGVIAAIFAIEQLVEMVTIVGGPGLFISPGGPMNMYLGAALFFVFFIALGIALSLTTAEAKPADRTEQQHLASRPPAA